LDGSLLATGGADGTAEVWDMATQRMHKSFGGDGSTIIASIGFSPDKKRLTTGHYDSRVQLWDLASEKKLCTLKEHRKVALVAAFSPDG
jgi:WD40 repeat protein